MKKKWLLILNIFLMGSVFLVTCSPPPTPPPIIIGAPLPMGYVYGITAYRAMTLAIEEINAKGGVNVGGIMRPFKLEVIDTRDLEPGVPVVEALLAVEKLILDKKADVILGGPLRSEAALAAMDLLSKYKKVSILTAGALSPAYHYRIAKEYDKYKYCFRITGEVGWLSREAIDLFEFIRTTYGFDRVFIMVQDVAHARAMGKLMEGKFKEKGYTVIGHEIYPTGATDYSIGLAKAKAGGAQLLFAWMDHPEIGILIRQWHDMKVEALPIGYGSAIEQPGSWAGTEGKVNYWFTSVTNAGNAPSNATEWTMKFYKAYKARWQIEPEAYGASSSYMAVYVLAEAIARAGSLDPDALIAALEKTDMMGVYGRIRFDPKNHQIIPSYDPKEGAVGSWFQWQDGKRVVVWPPTIAMGIIKLPPWLKPVK